MKKKLLAILTSVLMLCAMLPLSAVSVSAATSGTTGDCTWTLDGTHLTISGNGAMEDYEYFSDVLDGSTIPWGQKITSVTIGNDVTSIGKEAFSFCRSLTSVAIGNSVTSIGSYAFSQCSQLMSITIPNSVISIDDGVFYGCNSLTSITIGDGVTSIGDNVFDECSQLTSIDIPDGVTSIGSSAFSGCSGLTSIDIPDGVTSIGDWAFYGCKALTDVYYGGSEANKASVAIDNYNTYLLNATWHYADDPISDTVGHSVMDTANGNGLAFRFELSANGVAMIGTTADLTNATINYLGKDCKLIGMGAVITNDGDIANDNLTREQSNGLRVIDISVVYLQEVTDTTCAFATRIINIPDTQLERTIYARPYYIVEVDGEEIVVYGDVDSASCAEYM